MDEFSGDRDLAIGEHDDQVNVDEEVIDAANNHGQRLLYWVAIYDANKQYGGPEEGGWYYLAGELSTDPEVYGEVVPMAFTDEQAAIAYRNIMARKAKAANEAEGRRDISSVISTGEYFAEIHEGTLPIHYPVTRPHYE